MTLLHLAVNRVSALTHDERDAPGFAVSLEMLGLVIEWWIGVRR